MAAATAATVTDETIQNVAKLLCSDFDRVELWSFKAFQVYADVFHTIAEWRAESSSLPLLLMKAVEKALFRRSAMGERGAGAGAGVGVGADDVSPLIRRDVGSDANYDTIVVWENAPLPTRDRALLRVYLEMALDLNYPIGIIGNVTGIRQNAVFSSALMDDADDVTTDLFLLVHRKDVPRFMRPRSLQMGMRFYDELICEGKYFTATPTESTSECPQTLWDGPKN